MKTKRIISLLLITLCLLPLTAQARDMQMYVSGTYLTRNIESVDGFDMVPLLDISGELGFHSWFDGTTAIIYNDTIKFTFTMHSPAVYDQHGREYGLDIVPQMINGKFMIPAKFFVDHLNMTYTWDYVTDTVFLNSDYTYQWLIGTEEYAMGKAYLEEPIVMYSADGQSVTVPRREIPAWEAYGWSTQKYTFSIQSVLKKYENYTGYTPLYKETENTEVGKIVVVAYFDDYYTRNKIILEYLNSEWYYLNTETADDGTYTICLANNNLNNGYIFISSNWIACAIGGIQ